ncbi:MAG: hypothetical protein HKN94_16210 [Acidimicrobiales bacterium]|nr:hypothetical protein [Acidimicrobiales bacterium]RZV48830.1 MAG: hypothetical protein EX269_00035 [Acidimicrobiales bacterium]
MAVTSIPIEASPAARRYETPLRGLLHPGLPFFVMAMLPLFWALGLGYFTFVIAAVPMLFGLLLIHPIRIPKGYGWWIGFMVWTLLSAIMLEPSLNRYLSYSSRALAHIAAGIIFLYIYNLPTKYLPTGRILAVCGGLFLFTAVVGGYLGLILGETRLSTPFSQLLPQSMLSNSFVENIVRPPYAQRQDFLGFPLNRPAMPFSFTNDWGATLVPGTFLAIAAAGRAGRARRFMPVLALLAVVPMIVSVNRGLWLSLMLGVAYVVVRQASAGQLLLAIRLSVVVLFVGVVIAVSPLAGLIEDRATTSHSVGTRGELYTDVLERLPESPILGFGAPLANPDPTAPAIGTHGMFWTALFSQGVPGLIFYVGFWVSMAVRTGRNIRSQEHLWLHLAVASAIPTMFFYDHLPAALPLMMIAAAVILRDRRAGDIERAHLAEQSLAVAP